MPSSSDQTPRKQTLVHSAEVVVGGRQLAGAGVIVGAVEILDEVAQVGTLAVAVDSRRHQPAHMLAVGLRVDGVQKTRCRRRELTVEVNLAQQLAQRLKLAVALAYIVGDILIREQTVLIISLEFIQFFSFPNRFQLTVKK